MQTFNTLQNILKIFIWLYELEEDRWFSPGTPVSSTNKTDRYDITEILLKVALSTINQNKPITEIFLKVVLNTITLTLTPFMNPLWKLTMIFSTCWPSVSMSHVTLYNTCVTHLSQSLDEFLVQRYSNIMKQFHSTFEF